MQFGVYLRFYRRRERRQRGGGREIQKEGELNGMIHAGAVTRGANEELAFCVRPLLQLEDSHAATRN